MAEFRKSFLQLGSISHSYFFHCTCFTLPAPLSSVQIVIYTEVWASALVLCAVVLATPSSTQFYLSSHTLTLSSLLALLHPCTFKSGCDFFMSSVSRRVWIIHELLCIFFILANSCFLAAHFYSASMSRAHACVREKKSIFRLATPTPPSFHHQQQLIKNLNKFSRVFSNFSNFFSSHPTYLFHSTQRRPLDFFSNSPRS